MIYEKIISRRTIRKFKPEPVPREVLLKCVDAARLSPSAANRQPLKYIIVDEESLLEKVYETLRWAGYLPGFRHSQDEKPRAYIVILLDKSISGEASVDAGIAAMSISMTAYDEGLGSCILGAIDREKLRRVLNVPEHLDILLAVAIGYPSQKSVVEEMKGNDVKYWLDEMGVLHVPKRSLDEIVKWNGYK
ncbi:MAG: nitroreductase family protein [Nitrososphaerota archaeon]|nr:nitroreductase family protein [Candidatus Bathyarchaeota archaeon]MDW8048889.1 nitroreductase family protein [Nitrososphaerota archaeon]